MQTHFQDAKISKKNNIRAKSPRKKRERGDFLRGREEERAKSKEQRAMSKEQRAKSDEQ